MTKLDADGSALAYSTYLGGDGQRLRPARIAVDGAGSAYVTGYTAPRTSPTTPGAFDTTHNGGFDDAFVTKLNADGLGARLLDLPRRGGMRLGHGIAVDGAGQRLRHRLHRSTDFPDHRGRVRHQLQRQLRRLRDEAERRRLGARLLDLPGRERLRRRRAAIAVDGAGSAYVTGYTVRPTSRPPPGAFDTSSQRRRRRLRDEAQRRRLGARLLDLPGRDGRLTTRQRDRGRRRGQRLRHRLHRLGELPHHAGAFDTSYNGGRSTPS